MTEQRDQLETQLSALTEWEGDDERLWERAAESGPQAAPAGDARRAVRAWNRIAAAILVVASAAVLIAALMPSLRAARHYSPRLAAEAERRQRTFAMPDAAEPTAKGSYDAFSPALDSDRVADRSASVATDRHVIRKATIGLEADDVRAAFLRASHLVHDVDGEYVQDSSLTGSGEEGDPMRGDLTLRIGAARLSEVLNELRELGEVVSEEVTGQDVTSQVVDLEARLRNEQRIESELLELLEKRTDAPLKEVMELRTHLNQVRQEIERLVAQRDRLSRQVAMATVLVIIRQADAPPDAAPLSIWKHFGGSVAEAWRGGLLVLADTIAAILHILVAGLLWWVLLAVGLGAYAQHRRGRRLAESA